jgi:hypothetical protein
LKYGLVSIPVRQPLAGRILDYQHCAGKNLHRYLAEFEFRYNTRKITDGERAVLAVQGGEGKRLTYRQPH